MPLGWLTNADLRKWKAKLRAALEPLAEAKVRSGGCNLCEARNKGYKGLAGELGIDQPKCFLHSLDLKQSRLQSRSSSDIMSTGKRRPVRKYNVYMATGRPNP
uniref:hypothetical protein n=1 Tax=Caballeronia sp. LjRoot34 TaxID=3342325 RepID=UPI003F50C364